MAAEGFFATAFACDVAASAEEPDAAFTFDCVVPCSDAELSAVAFDGGVAAADDAAAAGGDLAASSVSVGDDAVAGSAAAAAGLVSASGFGALTAVPEPAGGVAVAITAFTAC